MQYKMIVLDMDDTLLTSNNTILDSTKEVLIEAQEKGIKVVLASGRPTGGMLDAAKTLKLAEYGSYILSYNGAEVTDMQTGERIAETYVSKASFDEVYDYLKARDVFVLTYIDNTIVYEGTHEYMNVEHELTGLPMQPVDDLKTFVQINVPKLMGVDDIDKISAMNETIGGRFNDDIHATTSKPFFLEFMNKNVSKGKVLKQLVDKLDIQPSEVMAFGDSNNDKDMLEFAGLGVAMGNANDNIKAIADVITDDHNQDGIARIVKQYL
ncbi:Cof-type HAD-IIB family hydrolase [Macrococcus epidermidis]|uniref:Cof-type HAD-IIB family hydrolase n=1 Tax=Macrococcus epidermidis TaxID=1902580 RepID=UPI0020B6CFA1|nr:Cof-type HAD-IIB family hydrolase [Macrococcus epidermidis]UTH17393.1 HAD family phosphatase [Macrococcus epidermidis]